MLFEKYFKNLFYDSKIIDNRMKDGTEDFLVKIVTNNTDHQFDAMIADTTPIFTQFKTGLNNKSFTYSSQLSSTMTVDEIKAEYIELVRRTVGNITTFHKKKSPVYKDFFATEMKTYTQPHMDDIVDKINYFIDKYTAHPDLGTTVKLAFVDLLGVFEPARMTQQQKISTVKNLALAISDERKALNEIMFDNLLQIARMYKGKPEYSKAFFDHSKFYADSHTEHDAVTVIIAPEEKKNSGEVNIVGKKARFKVIRGDNIKVYTVASLTNLVPGAQFVILNSDSDETIEMMAIGDENNPYLILFNQGSIEAEVTIDWL